MIDLRLGDCLEVMKTLEPGSIDAVVTDPPAGIGFMGKEFDSNRGGRDNWVAWLAPRLGESLRVIRPGGFMLCWAIPRTSHWTALAIEEAGWTIRDRIAHVFGTGYPKSKSCLKPGYEDWWLCKAPGDLLPLGIDETRIGDTVETWPMTRSYGTKNKKFNTYKEQEAATQDTGNAPSGRWPANFCLSHHEDCVESGTSVIKGDPRGDCNGKRDGGFFSTGSSSGDGKPNAHVYGNEAVVTWRCHEDCPVRLLDEQTGTLKSGTRRVGDYRRLGGNGRLNEWSVGPMPEVVGDSGSASRFFYCGKATKADKGADNLHPTVKSTALMEWLIKLICPEGGVVLDLFMGSGSTGVAAVRIGRDFIGMEDDPESFATAQRRIAAEQSKTALLDSRHASHASHTPPPDIPTNQLKFL